MLILQCIIKFAPPELMK